MSASDLEPLGQDLTPHYELGAVLGSGAFGSVHRARERATGREVALKLLVVERGALALERFLREGAVTATLDHPGIVRVHAIGAFSGRPCIVYELIEGETLSRACRAREPRARAALVRDAAAAVGHAHAHGVVHRDLKPENILVDGEGRVRVADFGLALVEGVDRLTRTGAMVGTPTHMAPEQFSVGRDAAAPAADVWSLGVVLYEALTGRLPFGGESLVQLAGQINEGHITRPRQIDPRLPPALEAVCLRALERDPTRRFPDAGALARAIDEALDGRDTGSRRRAGLALAGLALAALTLVALSVVARGPTRPASPVAGAPAAASQTPPTPITVVAAPTMTDQVLAPGKGTHWALWVDATRVLTGGSREEVRLWDATRGDLLRAWSLPDASAVRLATGELLVADQRGALLHLDPESAALTARVEGAGGPIKHLTCATGAARAAFVVVAEPRWAIVVDTASGDVQARIETPGQDWCALAFSADGGLLALSENAPGVLLDKIGSVSVFDVTGEPSLEARRMVGGVARSLCFDPDGHTVHAGLTTKELVSFEARGGEDRPQLLPTSGEVPEFGLRPLSHQGTPKRLVLSPDGRRLVSVAECPGDLTEVKVWDLTAREEERGQVFSLPGDPTSVDVSPDGRWLVLGLQGTGVHIRPLR